MPVLTDLPGELLEMIFRHLGSIDDVHHFGRTCRKLSAVIERQIIYTKIMRSVISQAPYVLQVSYRTNTDFVCPYLVNTDTISNFTGC
jgi:hypothetical protein